VSGQWVTIAATACDIVGYDASVELVDAGVFDASPVSND
jgi:hypothetical protein